MRLVLIVIFCLASSMAYSASAIVVSSCGSRSLSVGAIAPLGVDTTGKLCTNGGGGGGLNFNTLLAELIVGVPLVF